MKLFLYKFLLVIFILERGYCGEEMKGVEPVDPSIRAAQAGQIMDGINRQASDDGTLDSLDMNPPHALRSTCMEKWTCFTLHGWGLLKRLAGVGSFLSDAAGVVSFTASYSMVLSPDMQNKLYTVTGACIPARIAFSQLEKLADRYIKKDSAFLDAIRKDQDKKPPEETKIQVIVEGGAHQKDTTAISIHIDPDAFYYSDSEVHKRKAVKKKLERQPGTRKVETSTAAASGTSVSVGAGVGVGL
jgi:hypothetical protein